MRARQAGVYAVENTKTGKFYIGSSVDIEERLKVHRRQLRKGTHVNQKLQRAWGKYGEDAFAFTVVALCSEDKLREYEQVILDEFAPAYNIAKDATAPMRGIVFSAAQRANMGAAHRGLKLSPERRKAIGDRTRGTKHTAEAKKKMSLAWVGRVVSAETCAKISIAMKGKQNTLGKRFGPRTDEVKAKISAKHKGKVLSAEHCAKMSLARKGKKLSLAHRAAISAGNTGKVKNIETIERARAANTGKKRSAEQRARMSEARLRYLASQQSQTKPCDTIVQ